MRCTYGDDKKPVVAGKKSTKISIEVTVDEGAAATLVATAATDLTDAEFHDPNPDNDLMTITTIVD